MKNTLSISRLILLSIALNLFLSENSSGQVNRLWDYDFIPTGNYESIGYSIAALPSGVNITGGIYKNINNTNSLNALIVLNSAGGLLHADTVTAGFGFVRVLYDGFSSVYAVGSLHNDTNTARNLLICKMDTVTWQTNFFVPDSSATIYYDPLDMSFLSSGNLIVASRMDNFPLYRLALTSMNPSGSVAWQVVDSSFEINYDLKILPESSGGFFVAGSGRDTSTTYDFIFVSHFNSM